MFEEFFRQKRLIPQRLADFGFVRGEDGHFLYATGILDREFELVVELIPGAEESPQIIVGTTVTERMTGYEYVLYKTDAAGSFVGEVRQAVEDVLAAVAEQCCEAAAFRFAQTERVIEYAREKYGDEPEFLWEKFPDSAVLRRKDTQKWYGAILTTSRRKLGLESDERVEILDLRIESDRMDALLADGRYFRGWHMNKKHWFTVILDGSVDDDEIFARIDGSYRLARK